MNSAIFALPVSATPHRVLMIGTVQVRLRVQECLARDGGSVELVLDGETEFDAARNAIRAGGYSVYLIAEDLGTRSGLELLREAQTAGCASLSIFLMVQDDPETRQAAAAAGVWDCVDQTRLDAFPLGRMIRYAIRQHVQETEWERKVREHTGELEAAITALRDADRRKDVFLATLAHELRNPLAPIRNALELQRLMAGDASALEETRQIINRQVLFLTRLIDDLLDASRLKRGTLALTSESIDLRDVADLAIETSRVHFDRAGVQLDLMLPPGPLPIMGDRIRLTQVLANVLNNGARFTSRNGRLLLTMVKHPDEYEISIADSGVGIKPHDLPHVFDLFTQGDREDRSPVGGLGIGLALAKHLVELHQGSIHAASPGALGGTTITITLPCQVIKP